MAPGIKLRELKLLNELENPPKPTDDVVFAGQYFLKEEVSEVPLLWFIVSLTIKTTWSDWLLTDSEGQLIFIASFPLNVAPPPQEGKNAWE